MIFFCSGHWLTPNCSRISPPFKDQKLLIELLLEFPLPLEAEVGRADDENPLS
jgi:hypothetical protein